MNTRDFGFLYRKDIIVLSLLLVSISFAQIAAEQQLTTGIRASRVEPIFVLENPIFETAGIILPLFVAIYLFLQKKSKEDYSWLPPKKYWVTFSFLLLVVMAFPLPAPLEDQLPTNGTTTAITGIPGNTITNTATDPNPQTTSTTLNNPSVDTFFLGSFLEITRTAFVFLVVFLPLIIIFIIQRRSANNQEKKDNDEVDSSDQEEKTYSARTILECYYQASNKLEEMGADDSDAFTPTEFSDDVIEKKIITPKSIEDLTTIFEEAKFSDHEMTSEKVEIVKKIASSVVISDEDISNYPSLVEEKEE